MEEASAIGEQLLEALRHAHRFIVHRDLKPENVWIDSSGVVKLMDFGIARAYQTNELTRTGMNLGTAYYMAPEQHTDAKEVDWRADQYAFGVLMYELLTGRVPMGAVQPIEKVRKDIPRQIARAIMRAMSPRPDIRFDSLRELQSRIVSRREDDVPGRSSMPSVVRSRFRLVAGVAPATAGRLVAAGGEADPSSADAAAAASCPASAYRAPGSIAIPLATTSSIAVGSHGAASVAAGLGAWACA